MGTLIIDNAGHATTANSDERTEISASVTDATVGDDESVSGSSPSGPDARSDP